MPIKGLTDRGAAFPRIGELRKGAPKENGKVGKNLTYFRFTSKDPTAIEKFRQAYGDIPREINCYLPFGTVDENWQAWREEWTASSLQHRCDGEVCAIWLDKKTGRYRQDPIPCPHRNLPDHQKPCKATGRLTVIIPELERLAYVTALTTSLYDVIELTANLQAANEAAAVLGRDLRGIPFKLVRREREVSKPIGRDGGRQRVKEWLLAIEAAPSWVSVQIAAARHLALTAGDNQPAPLQIEAPRGVVLDGVDVSTGEIIDQDNDDAEISNENDGEPYDSDDTSGVAFEPEPQPATTPVEPLKASQPQQAKPAANTNTKPVDFTATRAAYVNRWGELWMQAMQITRENQNLVARFKLPSLPNALVTGPVSEQACRDLKAAGIALKALIDGANTNQPSVALDAHAGAIAEIANKYREQTA